MNFSQGFDWFISGMEWRGLRTKDHCHTRWLNGKVELFDLRSDPLQMNNLADSAAHAELRARLEARMATLKARRGDSLVACTDWKNWLDSQRRVVNWAIRKKFAGLVVVVLRQFRSQRAQRRLPSKLGSLSFLDTDNLDRAALHCGFKFRQCPRRQGV